LALVKHAISCNIQYADSQRFLVCQIVYEGATKECKQAIRPVKNGDLSTWVSATQDIVTQTYMATALAAALTKGSPTLSHTTCFGCGQRGHWKRDCHESKGYQVPKYVPPGRKPSKMCPQCNKGYHWAKDCKSKYHAVGRPLNGTWSNLQLLPKKEQFPVSSGKTPRVQDLISWF
jgi:hypothetical protein